MGTTPSKDGCPYHRCGDGDDTGRGEINRLDLSEDKLGRDGTQGSRGYPGLHSEALNPHTQAKSLLKVQKHEWNTWEMMDRCWAISPNQGAAQDHRKE